MAKKPTKTGEFIRKLANAVELSTREQRLRAVFNVLDNRFLFGTQRVSAAAARTVEEVVTEWTVPQPDASCELCKQPFTEDNPLKGTRLGGGSICLRCYDPPDDDEVCAACHQAFGEGYSARSRVDTKLCVYCYQDGA